MESIQNSLDELTTLFTSKMTEFQKELKGSIPAASPTSNINSQFSSFRSFVLTALENLQLQVELLSRQYDQLEMHTRKKIILLHGIPEDNKENVISRASNVFVEHLKMCQVNMDSIKHCHRLGRPGSDKPRAILVKFKDSLVKNMVWSTKTKLKGTGITMSEFLTKARHKTFLAARQRFGVTKCWTRDGNIIVLTPDGTRHRITNMTELQGIPTKVTDITAPAMASNISSAASQPSKATNLRAKRVVRK